MESDNKKQLVFITRPISAPWDDGGKNFALDLARKIHIPDLKIYLLTTQETIPSLPKILHQIRFFHNPQLTFKNKLALFYFLLRNDADLFHLIFVATPATSMLLRIMFLFKKAKTVQTVLAFESDSIFILKRMLYGDVIVCFSKSITEKIKKAGAKNIVTIPPGVDTTLYLPGKKKNIIAFLGELYRMKSYDLASELIPILATMYPSYTIFLGFRYSNKPRKEFILREQLKKLFIKKIPNAKTQIVWSDVIKDMPEFLKSTRLVVFPATTMKGKFNLPLVLIEALACGNPVVISPIQPINEYSDYPGFITPSDNTTAEFIKVIEKTLNEKLYNSLSKAARETAVRHFSLTMIAKQYERIYEKLISK